jgi:hypothetical protein
MEQFFTPTQRFQDIWENSINYTSDDPFEHAEVQLAIPVEDFLIYRWDWEDFSAFSYGNNVLMGKIIWITEDMFLLIGDNNQDITEYADFSSLLHARFTGSNGLERTLTLSKQRDSAISSGACSVFWRAIEASNSVTVCMQSRMPPGESFPSGPILLQFLRQSPLLQRVHFEGFHFWEEHCRAFATIQRTDLNVTLRKCTLDPLDAEGAFIDWFRNNQVVTELDNCWMGSRVLQALSGNTSVKTLSFNMIGQRSKERISALIRALATNQGIEELTLKEFYMNEETCRLLFRSLSTHPRIKFLTIRTSSILGSTYSAEAQRIMLNAILRMLHRNTVVYTIYLPDINDEEFYQNFILPRLEMNRSCFEVQRQAVKRADPSIRPQILGRALHVVQYNSDLVFRFLSENVPAFVRTEGEEEEEEASDIPLENDLDLVSGQKRKASS